jgi:membrane protein DedA with SNARE-associated domain
MCNDRDIVTEEVFLQLCEHLSDRLWLQGLLVAAGTCFLEDAARCGVGLLVAAGHMGWWVAFVGMFIGGISGDVGLYLAGRYATQFLINRRWIDPARLTWMESYFRDHAVKTVFVSRFLPGARMLAFSVAGVVRYPFPRFLLVLGLASAAQAVLFLKLSAFIGEQILPYLKNPRTGLPAIAMVVLVGILVHQALARRRKRAALKQATRRL